ARAHGRDPGERRGVEPLVHAARGLDARSCRARRRVRRRARARAERPDRELGGGGGGAGPARGHVPHLRHERRRPALRVDDARLTVAGATPEEVEPYLLEREGVEIRGRVTDGEKSRLLHQADLVCAPSLGGESFGMVLTEAFAAGTPVVCSDIAGYRDVVREGVDGLLVPAGGPAELGEALHALAIDPDRRRAMGAAARERAERFAWPTVASEVEQVYEQAVERAAEPAGPAARVALRVGLAPSDRQARRPPRRIPSIEPELP